MMKLLKFNSFKPTTSPPHAHLVAQSKPITPLLQVTPCAQSSILPSLGESVLGSTKSAIRN